MLPRFLKEGILSSVFKKKFPIFDPNNHRGITVVVVLSKIVETIMLARSNPILHQNPLQRGFSGGVAPIQASLLVQLAISEAQANGTPLYVAYLDAKAAFDVVWIQSLLRRLHTAGVEGSLWKMFQSLHTHASSRVKWAGGISKPFNILQGVRQGGVTSAPEYKQFINPLLDILSISGLGAHIGTVSVVAPTCADDVALLSGDQFELQSLLELAYSFSRREGYSLQPKKCQVVIYGKTPESHIEWTLGPDKIPSVEEATHIGVVRDGHTGGSKATILNNISKVNKAFFAKFSQMKDTTPQAAIAIYQSTILPILTYGTEVIILNPKYVSLLQETQDYILRQILGLPSTGVAAYTTELLSGLLPIEAVTHKRTLGLIASIRVTPTGNTGQHPSTNSWSP